MKTFQQHLFDVVNDRKGASPDSIEMCEEAARRYTTAAIKEHLIRAAENAKINGGHGESLSVDRESITNIDIELP